MVEHLASGFHTDTMATTADVQHLKTRWLL
jgi:hypothetical protein